MNSLSSAQRKTIGDGHRRVIAGAGSGKTATLVEQIRHYLESGIPPHRILAVTFTHRAGLELQDRIQAAGLPYIPAGTIHSWAYQALLASGIRKTLVMESDIMDIIAMVTSEKGVDAWTDEHLQALCDAITGQRPARKWTRDGMAAVILTLARGYMAAHGLIYVDEVIPLATKAILCREVRPDLLPLALCWDEYQDSTPAEDDLRQAIGAVHSYLVGDPRQAIYGFRGGDARLLMADGSGHYHLAECWRCPIAVIGVANAIQRDRPPLWPARLDQVGTVTEADCDSDGAIDIYRRWAETQEDQRLVVLTRSNARAEAIAGKLAADGVPAVALTRDCDAYASAEWRARSYVVRLALDPRCEWVRFRVQESGLAEQYPDDGATFGDLFPEVDDPHTGLSLSDWLVWYSRRDAAERVSERMEAVVCMTVHAAKGLEFDHVAVDGVGKGYMASDDARAVFYVAVTRARKSLLLVGSPKEAV